MPLSRFLSKIAAAVQTPGYLLGSLVCEIDFGSAEANSKRWKSGALSFNSCPTALHEKFNILSFVAVRKREGLFFAQSFLHSLATSEQIRSSIASFSPGQSIAASAIALKLLPRAKAFPSRWRSFEKFKKILASTLYWNKRSQKVIQNNLHVFDCVLQVVKNLI